jgi:hypothetical protein
MDFATPHGPIFGSALFVAVSDNAPLGIRRRRQIGAGSRAIIVTRPARTAGRRLANKPVVPRKKPMKRTKLLVTSFFALFLVSVAAVGIGAAVDTPRTLMSPADFSAAKKMIESESRVALAACRGLSGADKDICKAEVRSGERIKKADLAARYHGTVAAADEARQARVKASYDLAKARCTSRSGEERVECLRAARDDKNKSLADAKLASN